MHQKPAYYNILFSEFWPSFILMVISPLLWWLQGGKNTIKQNTKQQHFSGIRNMLKAYREYHCMNALPWTIPLLLQSLLPYLKHCLHFSHCHLPRNKKQEMMLTFVRGSRQRAKWFHIVSLTKPWCWFLGLYFWIVVA